MLLNCDAGEDSWESLGQQGDQTSQSHRKSILNIHWKDWCWSWNSSILAIWCKVLTFWKRSWCWENWEQEEKGGWDGWMASPIQWTWTWANSGRWWGTGRPAMLPSMGWQRGGHDLVTEQQQQRAGHNLVIGQQNPIVHYIEYLLLLPIWLKSQPTFVEYIVCCKQLQFSSV